MIENCINIMRFEVLTGINMKIAVYCNLCFPDVFLPTLLEAVISQ
jgi:hypothetical protein